MNDGVNFLCYFKIVVSVTAAEEMNKTVQSVLDENPMRTTLYILNDVAEIFILMKNFVDQEKANTDLKKLNSTAGRTNKNKLRNKTQRNGLIWQQLLNNNGFR